MTDELINTIYEHNEHRQKHGDVEIQRLMRLSDHYPPILDVVIDNRTITLNSDGEQIEFMALKNGSKIKILIEFDRIMFKKNTAHKIWRVIQLKKEIDISMTNDLFASLEMELQNNEIVPIKSIHIPPPPPPPFNMSMTNNRDVIQLSDLNQVKLKSHVSQDNRSISNDITNQNRGFIPPTQDELQSIIKKLKNSSVNIKNKINNIHTEVDNNYHQEKDEDVLKN